MLPRQGNSWILHNRTVQDFQEFSVAGMGGQVYSLEFVFSLGKICPVAYWLEENIASAVFPRHGYEIWHFPEVVVLDDEV